MIKNTQNQAFVYLYFFYEKIMLPKIWYYIKYYVLKTKFKRFGGVLKA